MMTGASEMRDRDEEELQLLRDVMSRIQSFWPDMFRLFDSDSERAREEVYAEFGNAGLSIGEILSEVPFNYGRFHSVYA